MGYKTREWRNSMRVTLDYNNMTDKFLGDKGFTDKKLSSYTKKAAAAFTFVKENRGKDELFMGWTELPYNQKELQRISAVNSSTSSCLVSAAVRLARLWRSTPFATCTITTCPNLREEDLNSTSRTT